MTNFEQLLPAEHPLVHAATQELRAVALNHLGFGDVWDESTEHQAFLADHLTNVGDPHAVLIRLEYDQLFSRAPHTKALFGELGINEVPDVNYFQFFVSKPHTRGIVHIDGRDRHCCLNLPLFNAERGTVEWFGTHNFPAAPTRVSKMGTLGTYPERYDDRYTDELADEAVITRGLQLVKTDIWHRVNNQRNNRYRLIFSLRLSNNPSFDDTYRRLRPHILRLQAQHAA